MSSFVVTSINPPPVAYTVSKSLYQPSNMATDSLDSQLGCAIYEEFSTVVILREQLQVTDNVQWLKKLSQCLAIL